jgi:hypothetical protein
MNHAGHPWLPLGLLPGQLLPKAVNPAKRFAGGIQGAVRPALQQSKGSMAKTIHEWFNTKGICKDLAVGRQPPRRAASLHRMSLRPREAIFVPNWRTLCILGFTWAERLIL